MKLLKSIKIEEAVLMCISLFFLIFLFYLGFFESSLELIIKKGWATIAVSVKWWTGGMIIFSAFLVLRIYLFLMKKGIRRPSRHYFNKEGIKNLLRQILFLSRAPFFIFTTTALGVLVAGALQQETKDRLVNFQLLNIDKILTSEYPLFWLHSSSNALKDFFNFLTPAIIYSFLSLAMVMGLLALFFFLEKDKRLFKGYIISLFIVFALASPLWFFFPANSPTNFLLYSEQNFDAALSGALQGYQPNITAKTFQEKSWEKQKNAPPVTTMPSMHWAWSGIIVYYLFKREKKSIFFSSIWLILDLSGTIYLGNHYLIDGLVALPLLIISLFLTDLLIKLEKKYYQESIQETEWVEKIRKWFLEPLNGIKYRLSNKT